MSVKETIIPEPFLKSLWYATKTHFLGITQYLVFCRLSLVRFVNMYICVYIWGPHRQTAERIMRIGSQFIEEQNINWLIYSSSRLASKPFDLARNSFVSTNNIEWMYERNVYIWTIKIENNKLPKNSLFKSLSKLNESYHVCSDWRTWSVVIWIGVQIMFELNAEAKAQSPP